MKFRSLVDTFNFLFKVFVFVKTIFAVRLRRSTISMLISHYT